MRASCTSMQMSLYRVLVVWLLVLSRMRFYYSSERCSICSCGTVSTAMDNPSYHFRTSLSPVGVIDEKDAGGFASVVDSKIVMDGPFVAPIHGGQLPLTGRMHQMLEGHAELQTMGMSRTRSHRQKKIEASVRKQGQKIEKK